MSRTNKNLPWANWKNEKPGYHEKTVMFEKCGKKCFLGPRKTFPICSRNTCKVNTRGVYAAYVRAQEYKTLRKNTKKYRNISKKAQQILRTRKFRRNKIN